MTAETWRDQAACRGMDPDLFHPHRGEAEAVKRAKAVCAECSVREECLEWALQAAIEYGQGEVAGIVGGTSARERRPIITARRIALGLGAPGRPTSMAGTGRRAVA